MGYPNPSGLMLPAFTGADLSMAGSAAPSPTAAAAAGGAAAFMPSFSPSFDISPLRSQLPAERRLSQPVVSSSLFLSADSLPKPRQASLTDTSFRPRPDLDFAQAATSAATSAAASSASVAAQAAAVAQAQAVAGLDSRTLLLGQPAPRPRQDSTNSAYQSSHSASSSVSSTHSFPYYHHAGSIDSSATDYSDGTGYAHEPGLVRSSRTPTAPYLTGGSTCSGGSGSSGGGGGGPAVPNRMMTTFSSKITSGTQKKHKCKVCDKRFTRPSSLQTHTYSHTGEKRMSRSPRLYYTTTTTTNWLAAFACEQDGCGRRFSVVSNLRRHKKVHQGKKLGE